jgi:hypothetical protein
MYANLSLHFIFVYLVTIIYLNTQKLPIMRNNILLFLFILFSVTTYAQSSAFGFKGGPLMGLQRWDNSFQTEPLFRYQGSVFIESYEEDSPFSLFAQAGYHIKGSSLRTYSTVFIRPDGSQQTLPSQFTPLEFRNVSLIVGAKQRVGSGFMGGQPYYMFGVRGDYTVNTKFGFGDPSINPFYSYIYPFEGFVRKFNYGFSVGGGMELPFSKLIGMIVELSVNPDLSQQYNQPAIPNIRNPNPYGSSSLITIPERKIANLTVELSVGFRFIHKVILVD